MFAASSSVNIGEGEAKTLSFNEDISTVFISDSEVADYQVINKRKLVVYGKVIGQAHLVVFGEKGKTLQERKLIVNKSYTFIDDQLKFRFPNSDLTLTNFGEQFVISGVVPSEKEKEDAYRLVGELLGKEFSDYKVNWHLSDDQELEIDFLTRRTYTGLVNQIQVANTKQVNVKLTVAEVSSSFVDEIGINWGSVLGDGFAGNGQFSDFVIGFDADNIAAFISAVSDDTVGQVLAEPNLSVISGESASFLVGGEIPIVFRVDDGYKIEYKEIGVGLDLAAKVLTDDKIKLSIQPQVSSIDEQYANELLGIPGFKVRKARTTVELGDGQSFVLGGLLSSDDQESLSKIPGLGDIPILGSLFRYATTKRVKTELIIVATVNLVEPIESSSIQYPSIERTSSLSRFFVGLKPEKNTKLSPAAIKWRDEVLSTGGFKE
ncbi:pilus assembly protein N-terminal domain-containing protein [Marinomonas sp. 15G1-11]|uniref:Pilus assembly protein N-terminal domain-containing protein n=1 Tax=Marinomonas phaeophyticola TaxID=3004091 RepID=A0ABT4JXC1_9GAMM|nr:pilus assembly protein N-terminal domain-containing protein [Marinomonas sp. 15G1-11]MCZ2722861.1 pilus assembly protein N-terminal domain-containing protein [Marinomonas sp. 15G1-11]